MGLLGMRKDPELERAIARVRMNMENNYKDAAQAEFRTLQTVYEETKASGRLKEKQAAYYETVMTELTEKLRKYTHADQKTAWTREDMM